MRLLGVNNTYPPAGKGGYAEICADVMSGLARAGHDVTVLTCRGDDGNPPPAVRDGVRVRPELAELLAAWRRPVRARRALREDRSVLRSTLAEGIDAALVWHLRGVSKPPMRLLHAAGVPVLYMLHDRWVLYERPGSVFVPWARAEPLAERLLGEPPVARQGVVCFNSRWLRDEHARLGWRPQDGHVIPCGLPESLLESPARTRSAGSAERLLFAGRIDPAKGLMDAIEALAKLPDRVTLSIAGPETVPGFAAEVAKRTHELGVSRQVTWLGELTRPELAAAFAAHDVLVYPSREPESFGLGILEGQAAELIAVTSAPGGPREFLVDRANCLLHAPGDPVALASALECLLDDHDLADRVRQAGRATAESMPVHAVVRSVEELIRRRVGDGAPSTPARSPG